MIEHLTGTILRKTSSAVVLDCHGVGLGVETPLSALTHIPPVGEACSLWIHTRVREDALLLYGFPSYDEKRTFEVLLQINGIGPKVALAILSHLDIKGLRKAVTQKETALLEMVPGIGARTAEKIILELSNRLGKLPQATTLFDGLERVGASGSSSGLNDEVVEDLRSALGNLGYKEKQVSSVLGRLAKESPATLTLPELVRRSLQLLQAERT